MVFILDIVFRRYSRHFEVGKKTKQLPIFFFLIAGPNLSQEIDVE